MRVNTSSLARLQKSKVLHACHCASNTVCECQVEEYQLPLEIRGELRPYQRAGIAWLAFLRRCGLHGVLADDMGLGKTLQTTAIIAGGASEDLSTWDSVKGAEGIAD